jgi:CheY-like chemotaxis protein
MRADRPILLVEDDEVDILSTQRAFRELDIINPLEVYRGCDEALTRLLDEERPKPCLILLDLNIPRISGTEFLRHYKSYERLRWIPSVVLTTSSNQRDIQESFFYQAAGYMVKPLDFKQFKEVIAQIHSYWSHCELPEPRD